MIPQVLAANTPALFMLAALIRRSRRPVFVSSELHRRRATPDLEDLLWERRHWNGTQAYADPKLHLVLLACGLARRWPNVLSNAMEPGWMPTKLSVPNAPATSTRRTAPKHRSPSAGSASGRQRRTLLPFPQSAPPRATRNAARQDRLVAQCEALTGLCFPA